jgi:hypothetical protein
MLPSFLGDVVPGHRNPALSALQHGRHTVIEVVASFSMHSRFLFLVFDSQEFGYDVSDHAVF